MLYQLFTYFVLHVAKLYQVPAAKHSGGGRGRWG